VTAAPPEAAPSEAAPPEAAPPEAAPPEAAPPEAAPPEAAAGALRVVVVDDSTTVRLVLSEVIKRETGLMLAGVAGNGRDALSVVAGSAPDVVVLDIEMPVLDGLGALKELKKRWPQLPVVMFSTLTERGAAATLLALAEGADDYATKPTSKEGPIGVFSAVRRDLVPLIRAWGAIARTRSLAAARQAPGPEGRPAPRPGFRQPAGPIPITGPISGPIKLGVRSSQSAQPQPAPFPLGAAEPTKRGGVPPRRPFRQMGLVKAVVIGSSTGGPNALAAVVPQFPANFPVPVLLVQHMPPTFTRMLAERLDAQSSLHVEEAKTGEPVRPGNLYVAQGGSHLALVRRQGEVFVELDDGPPENFCKPSVDVLFRAAASIWGAGTLGVVLTGMGQDGLAGARVIAESGGDVIAQDEATSVVWGMPGAVAKAGIASQVLPLGEIAKCVVRRAGP